MRDLDQYPDISKELQKSVSRHLFDFSENGMHHNSYDQEQREQLAIENGDPEALTDAIAEDFNGTIGTLSPDLLRHQKNIGIVVISLSSRSAIRGGLAPEVSFSLSDTFINEIEKQTTPNDVIALTRSCEFQYCRLVYDIKRTKKGLQKPKKNPHIKQCKDYIFSHLHDKLTVQQIAEELHMNENYLSNIFMENEGITLSEYIMTEKLNRAKNLLKYSDYSYSEIAAYLGFSSQSHFGSRFKKETGYTPGEYRREFQQD